MSYTIPRFFLFLSLMNLFACGENSNQTTNAMADNSSVKGDCHLSEPIPLTSLQSDIPSLYTYQKEANSNLNSPKPIQMMEASAYDNPAKIVAQNLALTHPDFLRDIFHRETGEALHNEITGIRQLTNQEVKDYKINAAAIDCYKVEMYNFFYNTLVVAIVNIRAKQVLGVNYLPAISPDDNQRSEAFALQLVIRYPEIAEQLKTDVGQLPSDYTISVEDSKCERSRHYCVAVIFQKANKKLWVIVDVNEWHVIGWQWIIDEDIERPVIVTERSIQNDFVMEAYCNTDNQLEKGDWDITYTLTSSDGLEIKEVKFQGKEVIRSAKLVDWHVSYTFNGGFGYSDAIGCPMFSSAAVVAFSGPEVEPIQGGGFALIQDFRSPVWPLACNYRYQNRFEFYPDGSFRITAVNLGIGCGADGEYRPVFRIDMAVGNTSFAQWNGDKWQDWEQEKWNLQDDNTMYNPHGYLYRTSSAKGGYFIEPGNGQFGDGGRGDNAYIYITIKKKEEGDEDMPTFGECCNKDYRQGPETFMQPAEKLNQNELIIWYVPQMYNDKEKGKEYCWAAVEVDTLGNAEYKTWQGVIGPKFIPFK